LAGSVGAVLKDEIDHTYRYDYDTRMMAADVVEEIGLHEVTDELLKVANDSCYYADARAFADPAHKLLDIVAITGALGNLTFLRNSSAASLNIRALKVPLMASFAVLNLQSLRFWHALPEVREILDEAPVSQDSATLVGSALRFVAASPNAEPSDCARIERFAPLISGCDSGNGVAGCNALRDAMGLLASKVGCGDTHAETTIPLHTRRPDRTR
jgi:hypothetical protein